jgi:hypothetical protein
MRLVLVALLLLCMASAAFAVDVPTESLGESYAGTRTFHACLGQNFTNIWLLAAGEARVFGNVFDLGATPGPITTANFSHHTGVATPMPGPYTYNLWAFDALNCTPIGSSLGLTCEGAETGAGVKNVSVDLCAANWVASGATIVGITPLTCGTPTGGTTANCYPRLMMDITVGGVDGCGSVVIPDDGGPGIWGCYQITAGGNPVDHAVTVVFNECPPPPDPTGACCVGTVCSITTAALCAGQYQGDNTPCDANTCLPVPVEQSTWGAVKALYR